MNYKPSELFIGLVDFISVILPGSLFTAILLGLDASHPIYDNKKLYTYYEGETSVAFWVAFALASFGAGHFLNSIASSIDGAYDLIRKCLFPYKQDIIEKILKPDKKKIEKEIDKKIITKKEFDEKNKKLEDKKIKLKQDGNKLYDNYFEKYRKKILRLTCHFLFEFDTKVFRKGLEVEESYEIASPIMKEHLNEKSGATNVYKWSQALLDTYFPAVAEQVNRSMAVSKFFRSLVLVSAIFIICISIGWFPDTLSRSHGIILGIMLLIFSFREYVVQRQKSVIAAYKGIVSLFHTSENLKIEVKNMEEEKITSKD